METSSNMSCSMCAWINNAQLHPAYAEARRAGHECVDWQIEAKQPLNDEILISLDETIK